MVIDDDRCPHTRSDGLVDLLPDATSKTSKFFLCGQEVKSFFGQVVRCLDSWLSLQAFPAIPSAATPLQGHALRLMGRHHDREDLLCSSFDKGLVTGD